MSAFVHAADHIDLIVTLACQVEAYVTIDDATDPRRSWTAGLTTTLRQHVHERITPTDLGRLLMAENVASVRHRYSSVDDTPEGVEYDGEVAGYEYRSVDLGSIAPGWIAAGLKALDSYEYQSCEHPGWETSRAAAWVDAIRRRLIGKIPGYAEADTWCYERPAAPARRVRIA